MVDHGVPVPLRAHFTCATLVVHLKGHRLHAATPILVRAEFQMLTTRHRVHVQRGSVFLKRFCFAELDRHLNAFHDAFQIHWLAEEIRVDHWFVERIGTAQSNLQEQKLLINIFWSIVSHDITSGAEV